MQDYRVMVLEGSLSETRAFLAGLVAGRDLAWDVHFCEECGVESESLKHRLLEKLGLEKDLTRVIVSDTLAARIASALDALPREARGKLGVHADDGIREASLAMNFKIFDRRSAAEVRPLLADPPAGVTVELSRDEEESHPSAKGVEAYAPEHDFIWRVRGTARGPVAGVLALRARLRAFEMIDLEPVHLTLAS
ncbi:MAG: hypothetical protein KAY32_10355 [Candidatus Eisenbacteria sp.]|nr:hypothetical protein [Candidatus Eisenbacteria bacterium]